MRAGHEAAEILEGDGCTDAQVAVGRLIESTQFTDGGRVDEANRRGEPLLPGHQQIGAAPQEGRARGLDGGGPHRGLRGLGPSDGLDVGNRCQRALPVPALAAPPVEKLEEAAPVETAHHGDPDPVESHGAGRRPAPAHTRRRTLGIQKRQQLLGGDGHLPDPHAGGVSHRVGHRGRRGNHPDLADSLGSVGSRRVVPVEQDGPDGRQVRSPRRPVLDQASVDQAALLVDELLAERSAESHGHGPDGLTLGRGRVERRAGVMHGHRVDDLHPAGGVVHLYLHRLHAERVRGREMALAVLLVHLVDVGEVAALHSQASVGRSLGERHEVTYRHGVGAAAGLAVRERDLGGLGTELGRRGLLEGSGRGPGRVSRGVTAPHRAPRRPRPEVLGSVVAVHHGHRHIVEGKTQLVRRDLAKQCSLARSGVGPREAHPGGAVAVDFNRGLAQLRVLEGVGTRHMNRRGHPHAPPAAAQLPLGVPTDLVPSSPEALVEAGRSKPPAGEGHVARAGGIEQSQLYRVHAQLVGQFVDL